MSPLLDTVSSLSFPFEGRLLLTNVMSRSLNLLFFCAEDWDQCSGSGLGYGVLFSLDESDEGSFHPDEVCEG